MDALWDGHRASIQVGDDDVQLEIHIKHAFMSASDTVDKSTAETDSRLRQQLLITGSTISNNRTHVHISLQTAGDPNDNL